MGGRGSIPFRASQAFLAEYGVTSPVEREMFYEVIDYLCGVEADAATPEQPAGDAKALGKAMGAARMGAAANG